MPLSWVFLDILAESGVSAQLPVESFDQAIVELVKAFGDDARIRRAGSALAIEANAGPRVAESEILLVRDHVRAARVRDSNLPDEVLRDSL